MDSKVRVKVIWRLIVIFVLGLEVLSMTGCSDGTNVSKDIVEILDTTSGKLIKEIEGTYYEAGGNYRGVQPDEVVQIKKNDDASFDVYWFRIIYENGIGGKISGYSVYALAENVPNNEFTSEKYVKLIGENINDTYWMRFVDNEILELEGGGWIFEKGEKEIDVDEVVKEYKEMHPEMEYQYNVFSEDVDILFWENVVSNMEPISFNKRWYEQYSYYIGDVGGLEIKSSVNGMVDVFINGEDYCSFHEDSYVIGDSYNYVIYQCENGIEFEFHPKYERNWSDINPLLRFNELDVKIMDEDVDIEYGADFFYDPKPNVIESEEKTENYSKVFTGDWTDTNSQRCFMNITCENGRDYIIEISWSQSASECYDWKFNGTYDEEKEGIVYTGTETYSVYNDDGSIEETNIYNDGTGLIYIGENGELYWEDNKEDTGKDCIFEKNKMDVAEAVTNVECDYEWYKKYECFYSKEGDIKLEIYCQNDVMLCADFSLGTEKMQWYVDVIPSETGSTGEMTYSDDGFIMTYYPDKKCIYIDTSDGLFEGEYFTNDSKEVGSEYIFPDSDRRYLTDTEISSLSKEMLGFARNEIIARHGRIFDNQIYKEYFESKSWYVGNMKAEEFDAQYEILLNDIEKANINLIKQYEKNK